MTIRNAFQLIIRSPLFWVGLLIRLCLLPLFESPFPSRLFIPFVDAAIQQLGQNPWSLLPTENFPYGAFLLAVLMLPKLLGSLIFGELVMGSGPVGLALFKLPLLFFDLSMLGLLVLLAGGHLKRLLLLYWMNPLVLFVCYVHGQLDLVSMTLVMASLLHLRSSRYWLSGILMGLALSSKFHVAFVAPFMMAYIWNTGFRAEAFRNLAKWLGSAALIGFVGLSPLVFANVSAGATFASPELARLLALRFRLVGDTDLYLGVLLALMVLGRLAISTKISSRGLIFGSGSLFVTLLIASHPGPGWYLWAVPFLTLLFATQYNLMFLPILILQALYLAYFLPMELFPELVATFPPYVWSGLFTALQASVLANFVALWVLVVQRECRLDRRSRPLSIGLAGDSGSGKNTLTEALVEVFGRKHCSVIEGDNYHKWERGHHNWGQYTHLHPKANHLFSLAQHVQEVSGGRSIQQSHYSHETGKFTDPVELKPSKTVIVQGLHSLYLRTLRESFDLKIFLSPDIRVRTSWKIQRDCQQRGYDSQKVLQQLRHREADSKQFIDSQAQKADLIVQFEAPDSYSMDMAERGHPLSPQLRITVWNDYDLQQISTILQQSGTSATVLVDPLDLNRVTMVLDSEPSTETLLNLRENLFPCLRHVTRSSIAPSWREGHMGLLQIIALWLIQDSDKNFSEGAAR